MDSLRTFFTVPDGDESVVIHCASMVTTNAEFNQKLLEVNVGGTKNMIAQCLEHPECRKMMIKCFLIFLKQLLSNSQTQPV